jgi:hypothetical protein
VKKCGLVAGDDPLPREDWLVVRVRSRTGLDDFSAAAPCGWRQGLQENIEEMGRKQGRWNVKKEAMHTHWNDASRRSERPR